MPNSYLTTKAVCSRYGISTRTVYRWMEKQTNPFPAPAMRPTTSHNLWSVDDIERWEQREAERNAA